MHWNIEMYVFDGTKHKFSDTVKKRKQTNKSTQPAMDLWTSTFPCWFPNKTQDRLGLFLFYPPIDRVY
uniref:Uncharacterized protein n=1 Tax=Populus trichocarpa TaxID=3694 RepID=A0A3N7H1V2_POPTR